jgi:tRNA-dihydrouridine synthase
MKDYLHGLKKPFLVLAPMYDVTDTVFRQIISDIAPPDFSMSEFVNVDGLASEGRNKLLPKIAYDSSEVPMIYQFWGKKPENYRKITEQVFDYSLTDAANTQAGINKLAEAEKKKIIGVDINMGCPDKSVVKNGCCGALINDHSLAEEIIEATREGIAGRGSLSVKTRLGFSSISLEWIEFLLSKKLNMLSIHLRTVKEMSKVPAHFEVLKDIMSLRDKLAPDTLIVANGDITDKAHAMELYEKYGIDGAMIGRGIFHNPFAFSEETQWEAYEPLKRLGLYETHVELFKSVWKKNERPIVTLNKFCKIYVNGFDGAKEMRDELMHARDADDLLNTIRSLRQRYQ